MKPAMTIGARLRWDSIERLVRTVAPSTVLEIGPGLGAVAARWAPRYSYSAVEPDPVSRSACREAVPQRSGCIAALLDEFEGQRFDLVAAFEVLEHIDDDLGSLIEWRDLLSDVGHVLLSVPAGPDRFGPWDEAVGHLRRYDRTSISDVLRRAGFDPVVIWYHGSGLGQALEVVRDRVAGQQSRSDLSVSDRTASSARILQPSGRFHGAVNAVVASPFIPLQRALRGRSIGTGLVVLAKRV